MQDLIELITDVLGYQSMGNICSFRPHHSFNLYNGMDIFLVRKVSMISQAACCHIGFVFENDSLSGPSETLCGTACTHSARKSPISPPSSWCHAAASSASACQATVVHSLLSRARKVRQSAGRFFHGHRTEQKEAFFLE